MLCISTSEWVLHTLLAGQNQFFNAKTTFCLLFINKITQKIVYLQKNYGLLLYLKLARVDVGNVSKKGKNRKGFRPRRPAI